MLDLAFGRSQHSSSCSLLWRSRPRLGWRSVSLQRPCENRPHPPAGAMSSPRRCSPPVSSCSSSTSSSRASLERGVRSWSSCSSLFSSTSPSYFVIAGEIRYLHAVPIGALLVLVVPAAIAGILGRVAGGTFGAWAIRFVAVIGGLATGRAHSEPHSAASRNHAASNPAECGYPVRHWLPVVVYCRL
jgi:hypothetical protein